MPMWLFKELALLEVGAPPADTPTLPKLPLTSCKCDSAARLSPLLPAPAHPLSGVSTQLLAFSPPMGPDNS